MSSKVVFHCMLMLSLSIITTCHVDKDKEKKCAGDLVDLSTCVPYVSGETWAPPADCCAVYSGSLQKSPDCFCMWVQGDHTAGSKINDTLAFGLHSQCGSSADAPKCPEEDSLSGKIAPATSKILLVTSGGGNKNKNRPELEIVPGLFVVAALILPYL